MVLARGYHVSPCQNKLLDHYVEVHGLAQLQGAEVKERFNSARHSGAVNCPLTSELQRTKFSWIIVIHAVLQGRTAICCNLFNSSRTQQYCAVDHYGLSDHSPTQPNAG